MKAILIAIAAAAVLAFAGVASAQYPSYGSYGARSYPRAASSHCASSSYSRQLSLYGPRVNYSAPTYVRQTVVVGFDDFGFPIYGSRWVFVGYCDFRGNALSFP